jgi:hypothetical protein
LKKQLLIRPDKHAANHPETVSIILCPDIWHIKTPRRALIVSTKNMFLCHQKYQVMHRRKLDEPFNILTGVQKLKN